MKKVMISSVVIALTAGLVWSCGEKKHKQAEVKSPSEIQAAYDAADKDYAENTAEEKAPEKRSDRGNSQEIEASRAYNSVSANLNDATSNNGYIPSSASAVKKGADDKFIRTAELKFRVKNVEQSTYAIEDIASKFEGFVTFTNLSSNIQNVNNQSISIDSLLETTHYVVMNEMIIRVPNTKLDTALKEIAKYIDFLDSRIIKVDDVGLQLLENQMSQSRAEKNEARMQKAIDNRGRKLGETSDAEDLLMDRQEQADNAKLANLRLRNQISYSTINVVIYQRESIRREVIADPDYIQSYEPGLISKIWGSLKAGWKVFEEIFVFLVRLWGVVLIIVVGYLAYRRFWAK